MKIKNHEIKNVPIDKIKSDGKNPNKMSEQQHEALKKNLEKYGNLVPVILNKDYMLADGEQRYTVYKEMGMKEIPAIILDVKEVDRRILRQVMNKLRGEHDLLKDTEEYKFIMQEMNIGEFSELLGKSEQTLINELAKATIDIGETIDKVGQLLLTCPKCQHMFKKGDKK